MYARVLTATVEPGRLEELVRAIQEVVQTTIKQRQGFKNAFVLTDPSTNKVMTISLWETEADLQAHVAAGRVPKHSCGICSVPAPPPRRDPQGVWLHVGFAPFQPCHPGETHKGSRYMWDLPRSSPAAPARPTRGLATCGICPPCHTTLNRPGDRCMRCCPCGWGIRGAFQIVASGEETESGVGAEGQLKM